MHRHLCKECGQEWEHKDEKQMIYSSDWYSGKCDRYENVSSFLKRVWYLIEDVEKYETNIEKSKEIPKSVPYKSASCNFLKFVTESGPVK